MSALLGEGLPELVLSPAPPITRPAVVTARRRKGPAVALVALGLLLVVGPLAGGFFSKAASGRQLLDAFRPHLQTDALARYDGDVATLRRASTAVDAVYAQQHVPQGRYPGIDAYRQQASAIDQRASQLLARVAASQADFRQVDAVGGFERVPFLAVLAGAAGAYGGLVLLLGSSARARVAAPAVLLVSAALVAYPFVSDLPSGSRAGERMVASLSPVMTPQEVSQLQRDFVVLVTAEGQLSTSFRAVPGQGSDIAVLERSWPTISSDLATLVGTVNDGIPDYRALQALDRLGGLGALPWGLVGAGAVMAALATAARPRRRNPQQHKEHP